MLVLKTKDGATVAEVDTERLSIGRDPTNDVVLEDASVSGFHAVILNDQGVLSIVDLGSTNGTVLDGRRLRERTEVKAWSTLRLGGVEIQVTDTESRQPTRVQPAVGSGGGRGASSVAATQVRPQAPARTRVAGSAQPAASGIRFESLRQPDAGGTRVVPPPARPAVAQGASDAATAGAPFSRRGGYPRGLVWLLFSFDGRVRRTLFWKFFGAAAVILGVLNLTTAAILWQMGFAHYAWVISSSFYILLSFWPWLAVVAKRIHDSGRRALPWGASLALFNVVTLVSYWLQANRVSPEDLAIVGLLVLLLIVPMCYTFYLVGIKRGEDGDNAYGDQNPTVGVVFGA